MNDRFAFEDHTNKLTQKELLAMPNATKTGQDITLKQDDNASDITTVRMLLIR